MTPAEVITEVRRLIQDTKVQYRYSDAVLLSFVNQTLKKMVTIRPDIFSVITNITTVPNTVIQTIPADGMRLVEVFAVVGGGALREVTREVMDMTTPGWLTETAGTPVNFMRHVRNPYRYFLYPAPTSGIELIAEYAKTPPNYGLNDTVADLRAKLFQESFTQMLGVSLQSRVLTDTEEGGMDPKQVI
jgi:hypothetical protein